MTRLYGRDEQIVEVVRATSAVLLIVGDQGTGKSELLAETQRHVDVDVIAPGPVSVAYHPAGLQTALLQSLGAAVALIADDAGAARRLGIRLADAARRLGRTRLSDLQGAAGRFILDAVRKRVRSTAADLFEDYISELKSSADERLSARITAAADPDVIEVFAELADEVTTLDGGRDIILALDNLERLTDDDMRRLADLIDRLPDRVRVHGTYATSSVDAASRLDTVRTGGCSLVTLAGLTEADVQRWLEAEELDTRLSGQVLHLTSGYPMYVADTIALLQSQRDLGDLAGRAVLDVATDQAWRQLSVADQLAAAQLSPFMDPLALTDAATYLNVNSATWALLEQRLVDARIFVTTENRRWFHELRRKYIRSNLLSTDMREVAAASARDLIDARLSRGELTAPLLVQRLALVSDALALIGADSDLRYVLNASLDEVAVAAAILELLDENSTDAGKVLDAQMVIWHAQESFNASDSALDALHRLVDANLVALASNELVAVVTPSWSSEAALSIAGRAAAQLGRLPVPSITSAVFETFLRPRIGNFEGAHHGVGRPAIADLAGMVARSAGGPGGVRRKPPAVFVRARHGAVPLYAAVMYSQSESRDQAILRLSEGPGELFDQLLTVRDVVCHPLPVVSSERFVLAVSRLVQPGRFWLHSTQPPDARRPYTLDEHTSRRTEMRSALRALCGDDERLIMRLDEQVGFLFDGDDSKSLVAEVYGWAEAKRVELGHSYSMSNPFARFHLANRARLVSGQRLGRISVSGGRWRPKDPALMEILEVRTRARKFNSYAERREIVLEQPWLTAQIDVANRRAATDAAALSPFVDVESQSDVGRKIYVAVFADQAKPGWLGGLEHATAAIQVPCNPADSAVAVCIVPTSQPIIDFWTDPAQFSAMFGVAESELTGAARSGGDAHTVLAELLGYHDRDVRVVRP